MKAKIAIILVCVGFLSGCSTGGTCNTCGSASYTYSSASSCGDHPGTCTCTDPNCGTNPCLSVGRCCSAFGNVGAYVPTVPM